MVPQHQLAHFYTLSSLKAVLKLVVIAEGKQKGSCTVQSFTAQCGVICPLVNYCAPSKRRERQTLRCKLGIMSARNWKIFADSKLKRQLLL